MAPGDGPDRGSATDLDPVVVVGGSLAGLTAAEQLRRDGYDGAIVVVEPEDGPAYDRPPLSKQVLVGSWEPDRATLHASGLDLGLDWRRGSPAESVDLASRSVRLASGEELAFGGLVLATGTSARTLPGAAGVAGVHVLRTLDDCLAIRSALDAGPGRVVVVGAGFIGAEVAASCRERGLDVTMVEVAEVPLERAVGREVGRLVADIHLDHGVDVRLSTGVDAFVASSDGRLQAVRLTDGDTVECGLAVVGVGVAPNTGWLSGSGLDVDDGIVTDECLRAGPGVVAVGDVARWPSRRYGRPLRLEHWENAVQSGEQAARTLLADARGEAPPPYDPVPWFWSDQYDRKIQLAGHSGADDRFEVVHGSIAERRFVGLYGRQGKVVGVLGVNRPRHVMQLRQHLVDGTSWDDAVAAGRAL